MYIPNSTAALLARSILVPQCDAIGPTNVPSKRAIGSVIYEDHEVGHMPVVRQ